MGWTLIHRRRRVTEEPLLAASQTQIPQWPFALDRFRADLVPWTPTPADRPASTADSFLERNGNRGWRFVAVGRLV